MSGELTKLLIKAYSDVKYSSAVAEGEFKTLVNPENYSSKYKIEQSKDQAQGTSASAPKFKKALPEDLNLEFLFDGTGVFSKAGGGGSNNGIINDIEKFKHVVCNYNGDKHQPNYLIISWGALLFKGKLTELEITYKLFKPDGTPLRAVAKARFQGAIEDKLRVAKENNTSPDLTHIRIVKAGDKLPLMAFQIYGDPKYYLEVARINKITNFRNVKTGQKIFFPPLQKSSDK
jgi:nucleoid-associated protein YgaU